MINVTKQFGKIHSKLKNPEMDLTDNCNIVNRVWMGVMKILLSVPVLLSAMPTYEVILRGPVIAGLTQNVAAAEISVNWRKFCREFWIFVFCFSGQIFFISFWIFDYHILSMSCSTRVLWLEMTLLIIFLISIWSWCYCFLIMLYSYWDVTETATWPITMSRYISDLLRIGWP